MCSKRCFMFCVVLALALVQVMAWPWDAKETKVLFETEQSPAVAVENSQNPSSEEPKTASADFSEISTKLDGKLVVVGNDLVTLKEDVNSMASALAILIADNRALNDSLEEMTGKYEKANGTKFFADLGAAFGFKSERVQLGAVGDMGIRFGRGFMVKTGVQYMVCDFGAWKMPEWSIENLTVSATIGWEW